MKQLTLSAGTIIKVNGIPIRLSHDAVVEGATPGYQSRDGIACEADANAVVAGGEAPKPAVQFYCGKCDRDVVSGCDFAGCPTPGVRGTSEEQP